MNTYDWTRVSKLLSTSARAKHAQRSLVLDKLDAARRTISAQQKYIRELERQLEPGVLQEIRSRLSEEEVISS